MGKWGPSRRTVPVWYDCTCQTCGRNWAHFSKGPPQWNKCPGGIHPWRNPKDRSAFMTFNSYTELAASKVIRQQLFQDLGKLSRRQERLTQEEKLHDRELRRTGG